ncbi:MAG: TIGR03546 family protein [Spirochaetales bacterium]|nr:TIGR03546 family protein [Spirochaetales bacterium]
MISFIAKLVVALNSNSRPGEMASGIAFGLLLAFIPAGNLLWITIFILAFFIKHNIAAMLLSFGLFRIIISVFDSFLDLIGGMFLEISAFQDFFTYLYNVPLFSYSNFNNTIVMGGFILGMVLWVPVFILFTILIKIYRKKIAPKVANSKFVKFLGKVPIVSKISASIQKLSFLVS